MLSKRLFFLFILVIYLLSLSYYQRWDIAIISGGDEYGYHLYLPAIFINQDLDDLKQSHATRVSYHEGFGHSNKNPLGTDIAHHVGEGKQIIKYTMGLAILESPFFLLGHIWAKIHPNFDADGFSLPYVILAFIASITYVFAGLWILYTFLNYYVHEKIVQLTIIALTLATNLYFFTIYRGVMAHAYLFALYCFLLYGTHHFYRKPQWKTAALIGFCCGMITLIRPVEVICILIPLSFGLTSKQAIIQRIKFIRQNFKYGLAAATTAILVGLPQLFYWKWISGDFLFYSYGDEGFDFSDPRIWDGLFSYQNGWLVYTPIMYLALIGILFLLRYREWLFPILLSLPLQIYIIYSWWCWNYVAGFGSRPMVDIYPLLSIPLAYCLAFLWSKKWLKGIAFLLVGGACFLNLFQTYQYNRGILWSESVNEVYYWSVFLKTSLTYENLLEFDSNEPQPTNVQLVTPLHLEDFENDTTKFVQDTIVRSGHKAYVLNKDKMYAAGGFTKKIKEIPYQKGDFLRLSTDAYQAERQTDWSKMSQLICTFERDQEVYDYSAIRLESKICLMHLSLWGGEAEGWDTVTYFVQIPDEVQPNDICKVYIMNRAGAPIYLDDFKVELWREN